VSNKPDRYIEPAGESDQITPVIKGLYLGDLKAAESLASRNPRNIRAVVTLCSETVERRAQDITYRYLPIRDSRPIPQSQLQQVLNAIAESIKTGSVLIHCAAGVSRTPTMAAAYLHYVGWREFPKALAYLAQIRPQIGPSLPLVESVIRQLPPFVRAG
jgi:protein-tyrosine phosphatase